METKVLIVAIVERANQVLLRKKPDGSPPYRETWYLFGAEAAPNIPVDEVIEQAIHAQSGVTVAVRERISWDTEIKYDLDGIEKFFVYLDVLCDYKSGELLAGEGIERLEWVDKGQLEQYDIVPPSRILFRKLGYMN